MESYRDIESRSSPMTSARDSLWRNIRAITNLVSGTRELLSNQTNNSHSHTNSIDNARNTLNGQEIITHMDGRGGSSHPMSSTASVSNNHNEGDDYLAGEPVIVHDDGSGNHLSHHPYASNHSFLHGNNQAQRGRDSNVNSKSNQVEPQKPLVMIDRDREATLSEEEVRQILEIYNKNMDESTRENNDLKDQITQLISHLREEEQRVYAVQQEIQELKNQQVSSQAEQEKINLQVSLLKFFKETKEQNPFDEQKEVETFKKTLHDDFNLNDDIGIDALEDLDDQIKYMKRLEYQVNLLELENQHLTKTDQELSQFKNQIKWCVNCRKDFKVSDNGEHACTYHFGKMKYYSCKGCGSAEYYSCCWRCPKCDPNGCRSGKHISQMD
eukprot:403347296